MRDSDNTKICDNGIVSQTYRRIPAASPAFTIIELIMVVVLIGILAVGVVPKFVDTSGFSLEGAAAMVVADIRYTQELAMGTHASKKVEFTQNGSTYTLKNSDESVVKTVELPSAVTVSSSDVTFQFNSLGEPITGAGSSVVLGAGGQTKTITVDSYTGRVSAS